MADMPSDAVSTAVVNWFDTDGNLHIRVYSSDGYNVLERCSDQGGSGWTNGSFSAPGSAVSATVWMAGADVEIRVYCTSDGVTTEWCNGASGWTQGSYTTT